MTAPPWGSGGPSRARPGDPAQDVRGPGVLHPLRFDEPTLAPGDRVLVQKVVYGPDRGDVIVFSDPKGRPGPDRGIVGGFLHWLSSTLGIEQPEHEDFIKRVIGLPGATVECRGGSLLVDGTRTRSPIRAVRSTQGTSVR